MSDMETRAAGGKIQAISEDDRTFELRIVQFGVVDSFGSVWDPGVFEDSLRTKLPPACWSHDWSRVIGSVKEHEQREDGDYGLVQMADPDEVPDSRMAYSLIKDKHITDTSFGFKRQEWQDAKRSQDYAPQLDGERERMQRARLDEVSPVLVGSVPGARVLAVRSEERITRMDAGQLLTAVASGQVTLRDALNSLEDPDSLRVGPSEDREHSEHSEDREDDEVEIAEEDVEMAFALMALDEDRAAGFATGNVTNPKGTAQLKEYWAHGKGALKIRWGTEGDHTRCVEFLRKYLPPNQVHGFCTNVELLARGSAGHGAGDKGGFRP